MNRVLRRSVTFFLAICLLGSLTNVSRAEGAAGPAPAKAKILFLHHSTGEVIWNGGVKEWFDAYNQANKTEYDITEQAFPKDSPYGWNNYPYDYWNIWVKHAGKKAFKGEPTLEMLTPKYDVIIFKHCFPVSGIDEDSGNPDVASEDKRIENYKLQYAALKKKLREFPKTTFIVWTGAALVKGETDEAAARRAKAFFDWVRTTWDERGDNIYIWDFQTLETEGGLYLKPAYAAGDSHPNESFAKKVAPLFCQRVVDVIRGAGDTGDITGKGGKPMAAAPQVKPAEWRWIVFDLTKLELNAEGEKAYAAAGKPARPNHLTSIRLATHKKNERADFAIDDITFYRVLPQSLSGAVQAP